jgi:hypothetical protein
MRLPEQAQQGDNRFSMPVSLHSSFLLRLLTRCSSATQALGNGAAPENGCGHLLALNGGCGTADVVLTQRELDSQ